MRPSGLAFIALPDKRFTFDRNRAITPEHLVKDNEQGPDWSLAGHYDEWARCVDGLTGDAYKQKYAIMLEKRVNIHFHVWDYSAILEMFAYVTKMPGMNLQVEMSVLNSIEVIWILIARIILCVLHFGVPVFFDEGGACAVAVSEGTKNGAGPERSARLIASHRADAGRVIKPPAHRRRLLDDPVVSPYERIVDTCVERLWTRATPKPLRDHADFRECGLQGQALGDVAALKCCIKFDRIDGLVVLNLEAHAPSSRFDVVEQRGMFRAFRNDLIDG